MTAPHSTLCWAGGFGECEDGDVDDAALVQVQRLDSRANDSRVERCAIPPSLGRVRIDAPAARAGLEAVQLVCGQRQDPFK